MQQQHRRIPTTIFDQAHTRLDSYLRLIRDVEQERQRTRWHTYAQFQHADIDNAVLVERLRRQMPTPHLDAAEERVN